MSVHTKKIEVMRQVDYLQKTGKNEHFGYRFATADDVVQAIRDAFIDVGLSFSPSVIAHSRMGKTTILHWRMVLTDIEDGSEDVSEWVSEADDTQDKGVPKAQTAGVKYWLLKTFLVPVGEEDPDALPPVPEPPDLVTPAKKAAKAAWLAKAFLVGLIKTATPVTREQGYPLVQVLGDTYKALNDLTEVDDITGAQDRGLALIGEWAEDNPPDPDPGTDPQQLPLPTDEEPPNNQPTLVV